jgi:NAD+-dependent farnesol dehydrogenase
MKYFITGGTGFIGHELAKTLIKQGHQIHLLVRRPEKAASLGKENVTLFRGDVTDFESVNNAIKGCSAVFHMAALAKVWSKNPELSYLTNVMGTRNVLEAAISNKVEKIVFTSSAGTLRTSDVDKDVDEQSEKPSIYLTEYEKTKSQAEEMCFEYVKKGLNVVIVNPSRVYGPGVMSESNSVTRIISLYQKGKWHILPGDGDSYGNYVFIDDVVSGHLLAM